MELANEEMVLETGVAYTTDVPTEAVSHAQPLTLSTSVSKDLSTPCDDTSPRPVAHIAHIGNTVSDGISTPSSKYPPLTLGGAIGIRRPRSTNSQAMNNLTLDQLNPTLAEALAAMKAKSGCTVGD
ncbi:hypothetical protein OESDEN_15238 [Oesophagostomum dentatum]|uniref:Uncharacterized protein n=1 Tax=Oesophagostomum dentatum TaxID=61180 RepID=A0A0B1SMC9_OESDE|nr:hypothetical protein OESDEN_15238 [Oesophagostomum dentatum]